MLNITVKLSKEDIMLLKCAFEVDDKQKPEITSCNICALKDRCSSEDEGNGFNNMGRELLLKVGIL